MVNENNTDQLNLFSDDIVNTTAESTTEAVPSDTTPVSESNTETSTENTTAETSSTETTTTEETAVVSDNAQKESSTTEEKTEAPKWDGISKEQENYYKQQNERIKEFEEKQRQDDVVRQADTYKKQLEEQGYMPEQAQQIANMQVQQVNREYEVQKHYNTQLEHMKGKFNAITHFQKEYGVDPEQLMQFEDPKSMEAFAKKEKKIKDLENELAGYKDKQVPPQSFDNSQAEPSATTSEDRLLDLYNQGVRNADTEAAARRATGL